MPLYLCEPQSPLTAEYGPLCAYLFSYEPKVNRTKPWRGSLPPNLILTWKVTCIVPYVEAGPNRGLDCKVKVEGFPLEYVKERALDEAMKQAGYRS